MSNKLVFICIFSFYSIFCHCQAKSCCDSLPECFGDTLTMNDSTLSLRSRVVVKIDKISASSWYRMTYTGVPLIFTGLIVKKGDTNIRTLRDEYVPRFTKHFDDYTQYLPGAIMLGMKIGGVEGRSSWSRMLTSDLFSVAIMGGVVNTMKTSFKVTRPDGSNNHSFPSGHTATAFMCATMLHREYGMTRSPWYSIGAYSVATATGIGRMLNNKHWFSDVLVGAGIGIISTELGYFFADMIFKDKGLLRKDFCMRPLNNHVNPSFFGLYAGLNIIPGKYRLSDGAILTTSTGSNVGIEGAWFPNTYWGIGGRLSVANMPIIINNDPLDKPAKTFGAYFGPYFSYPFTSRWLLGSKFLCGYSLFSKGEMQYVFQGKNKVLSKDEPGRIGFGTGLSLTYFVKQNFAMKFFADYSMLPSFSTSKNKILNVITLGSSANIIF